MNSAFRSICQTFFQAALLCVIVFTAHTQAQETVPTAQELAAKLNANLVDGSSLVRLKLEINPTDGSAKTALQLQVKSRRTKTNTEIIYQVLWPKERKGESFLLKKTADGAPTGTVFTLPDSMQPITSAQMKNGIFGSGLSYEDLIENFFAWQNQTIIGTETVDRVPCQIIESKPGKGDRTSYAKVRSWIDTKRMVPLRVEKYAGSDQPVRRITTTRVAKDDTERPVPAGISVQHSGQNALTELEGSNSRHDVTYTDNDFTPEALRTLSAVK